MISPEKQQQALTALHRILCHARTMALTAEAKIAGVLDSAELLPLDIADEEDRTAHFQRALGGAVGADEKFKWCWMLSSNPRPSDGLARGPMPSKHKLLFWRNRLARHRVLG